MELVDLLQATFGFVGFRANQEAVCQAAADGRDVLLVMPTGAGKSLCYQLPAIARGGTALVISPLIALMDDQANKLSGAGLRVARIHSGLSRDDARQACREYLDGRLQFLFIAPERMRVPGFPEMLAKRKPALVAIDEAHCISAWGHDFRPDYRTLGEYLPTLRPSPIIALTATATPTVQRDIVAQLHLEQPALFIHGFRRDNLAIEVMELAKPQRTEFIVQFLKDKSARPAIVYAPSRKAAEELAVALSRQFPAASYHAGLDARTRERVQKQFLSGELDVVVATIAFGMGIDKADVRTVIHAALPASIEAFYQEIGRAGRDGLPSRTVLLHSFADRKMHEFFLERDYPPAGELTRVAGALTEEFLMPGPLADRLKMDRDTFSRSVEKLVAQGAAQIDRDGLVRRAAGDSLSWKSSYDQQVTFRRGQIDRMAHFAETQQCRMSALIRHFGDTAKEHRPCGVCDFCAPSAARAQSFADPSAAEERDLRVVLRALDGGVAKAAGRLFTDTAVSKDRRYFDGLLDGLVRASLIAMSTETFTNEEGKALSYKKVTLTHEGRMLESGDPLGVVLRRAVEQSKNAGFAKAARKVAVDHARAPYTEIQRSLEERLRQWRKAEAAQSGKPAFLVFSDSTLHSLVLAVPRTIPNLLQVPGFGPDRTDRYGSAICSICRGESVPCTPQKEPTPAAESTRQARDTGRIQEPVTFVRSRTEAAEPTAALDATQLVLDEQLRRWRKTESERMGLPQFFVLGSSTLRSIVLTRPKSLRQLQTIEGIGPEKIERFGESILAICNA